MIVKLNQIKADFATMEWWRRQFWSDNRATKEEQVVLKTTSDDKKAERDEIIEKFLITPLDEATAALFEWNKKHFLDENDEEKADLPDMKLEWNEGLAKSARFHAINLANGLYGIKDTKDYPHYGAQNSEPIDRMKCYVNGGTMFSENIAWNSDGKNQTTQLFVDAGV